MSESDSSTSTSSSDNKPVVQNILPKPSDNKRPEPGSTEWAEQRKENHKKVERKRREAINSAMTNLGNVIPGDEKNKSKILNKAVEHILALNKEIASLKRELAQYQGGGEKEEEEKETKVVAQEKVVEYAAYFSSNNYDINDKTAEGDNNNNNNNGIHFSAQYSNNDVKEDGHKKKKTKRQLQPNKA